MRRVKCVSPHGGAHHGTDAQGDPVGPGYSGPMFNPPHEGGYVDNHVLGRVAVGDEVDAPEPPEFIADGFHFVNESGTADVCQKTGRDCWCGQHRDVTPIPVVGAAAASTPAATATATAAGGGAGAEAGKAAKP